MKIHKLLLLIPISTCLSSCTSYFPKRLNKRISYDDVYLIMGQSNATGISPYSFLEDSEPELYQKYIKGNDQVLISYDADDHIEKNYVPAKFGFGANENFFGPEIGIAEELSKKETTSYIIKATYSGSCLQTEYVSNTGEKIKYYKRFIPFIKEQLVSLEKQGKHPRLRGMFWMQGESDSILEYRDQYDKAETYFYKYLRHDLNKWIYEYFNFVDAYIFTRGLVWVNPEVINACKDKFVSENEHCYCIKTNGEDENAIRLTLRCETGEGDDLAHYDSKSMLLLGKTAATYLMK